MDVKNFNYPLKNMPIPTKSNFTEKTIKNFRRLRWKAYHFCKSNLQSVNESIKESFGFKKTLPPNMYLNPFESALYDLIQQIEFSYFQNLTRKINASVYW